MRRTALILLLAAIAVMAAAPSAVAGARGVAQAALPCSESAAEDAIRASTLPRRAERELRSIFQDFGFLKVFSIDRVFCRDLTGDGAQELVVGLLCCTVGSPDPWAIFVPTPTGWLLAFDRINLNIWPLKLKRYRGRVAVLERLPIHRFRDPNCCPWKFRYRYTYWDGTRFRVRRGPRRKN